MLCRWPVRNLAQALRHQEGLEPSYAQDGKHGSEQAAQVGGDPQGAARPQPQGGQGSEEDQPPQEYPGHDQA